MNQSNEGKIYDEGYKQAEIDLKKKYEKISNRLLQNIIFVGITDNEFQIKLKNAVGYELDIEELKNKHKQEIKNIFKELEEILDLFSNYGDTPFFIKYTEIKNKYMEEKQ